MLTSHSICNWLTQNKLLNGKKCFLWKSRDCRPFRFWFVHRTAGLRNNQFVDSHYWEDFAFTAIQIMHSQRIYLSNDKGYFYRRDNPESVSSRGSKINPYILDVFKVTDKVEEIARRRHFQTIWRRNQNISSFFVLRRITDILNWDIPANIKWVYV